MDFCDVYYKGHNTSEEYISHCLEAEMQEFLPSTVIFTLDNDTICFYISDEASYEDIVNAVCATLTLEDIKLSEALSWAHDVADNLNYINNYDNEQETALGLSNTDGTCGKQAKIHWQDGGIQITIQEDGKAS
jgi:hypothetical protein